MKTCDAFFFDWSGTLFDDLHISHECTNKTLNHFGGPELTLEQYRETFELPVWKFYKRYLQNPDIDKLHEFYFDAFYHYLPRASLFEGAFALIEKLKGDQKKVYIFSTVDTELLKSLCDREKLTPLIDDVFSSVRDKERQFPNILKRLNINPARAFFAGDMEHDIMAAQKAGAVSAAFTCGYRLEKYLRVLNPDYLFGGPGKMLKQLMDI